MNYFGARYLDPMLGLWTSVDPKRQFTSPYLYAGNGVNPVNVIDPDGNDAMVVVTGNGKPATGYRNGKSYAFTAYRTDVYLNTEKWEAGKTYKDYSPDKSYWVGRDAWKPVKNKAVISGSGMLSKSQGVIGRPKGWLAATNNGEIAGFTGVGPDGEITHWDGLSFHEGYPKNSDACVTFDTNSDDFDVFKESLMPDLNAKNPVSVEFEPFTPEDKP